MNQFRRETVLNKMSVHVISREVSGELMSQRAAGGGDGDEWAVMRCKAAELTHRAGV